MVYPSPGRGLVCFTFNRVRAPHSPDGASPGFTDCRCNTNRSRSGFICAPARHGRAPSAARFPICFERLPKDHYGRSTELYS
jgi:hypothetical protein